MNSTNFDKLYSEDIKKFQNFISRYWKKNHIFTINDKVLNWQYKKVNDYNFFVAKKNNNIIGIQGFIPLKHFDKNLDNNQIFLAFRKVIEGKHIGVGLKLHEEVFKECKPKFVSVIGVNEKSHNFLRWQGFNVEKMDHHAILSQSVNKFKIAVVNNLKIINKKKNKDISFIELNIKNIKFLLVSNFYKVQIPLKSNNYIINRYLKHPFYKYQVILIMQKKKPEALMVIRPIKINNSLVLRFVDFIGTSKSFLLTYDVSIKLLQKYKAEYIDIYSHGIAKKIFNQAGYINRYKEKSLIIPNHFEPFERKNIDIYCASKSNYKNKIIRLFKGDGDGDRPSIL
jgi:hypothetical protein|tara:strand:- start:413 stop:1432 length:1020 start_codon:yes stop_codon:yes gene_type:complete